jgi:pyridoxine 4-dehydrogenase
MTVSASAAGSFSLGGSVSVNRLGYGAMRITGPGIMGEPRDVGEAGRVLHRAVELGVTFIDTAHAYGPLVSERLTARRWRRIRTTWSSLPKVACTATAAARG